MVVGALGLLVCCFAFVWLLFVFGGVFVDVIVDYLIRLFDLFVVMITVFRVLLYVCNFISCDLLL